MNNYRVVERTERVTSCNENGEVFDLPPSLNSTGFFVQNRNGATVAGPFKTRGEAWHAVDNLSPLCATVKR